MGYPSMDLRAVMGQWATTTVTVETEAFDKELGRLGMVPEPEEREREDVRDVDLVVEVPEELL